MYNRGMQTSGIYKSSCTGQLCQGNLSFADNENDLFVIVPLSNYGSGRFMGQMKGPTK